MMNNVKSLLEEMNQPLMIVHNNRGEATLRLTCRKCERHCRLLDLIPKQRALHDHLATLSLQGQIHQLKGAHKLLKHYLLEPGLLAPQDQ